MSGEINVLSRTQIIVVEPTSGSVAIINAGPIGPQGPEGPPGADSTVPGPPGNTEQTQDDIGAILANSTAINLTYDDDAPSITATLNNDGVGNMKLANMAQNTIKGRVSSGTGDPEDLSASQARTVMDVPSNAQAILKSLFTAKGDLVVATGSGAVDKLAVGQDSQVLIANSGVASGMEWSFKSLYTLTWKVVSTSRNSTTTPTDDPDLVTTNIPANAKARFRALIWWTTPAAADFKFSIAGPSGAYGVIYRHGAGPGGTPAFGALATAFAVSGSYTETSGTDFGAMMVEGVIQNSSTAGPIKVQWAQNTSNGSNTTLMQGSWIEWQVFPF